jgi:predicted Zn-dependent protease
MRRAALLLVAALASACATPTAAPAPPPLSVAAQEQALLARAQPHDDPYLAELLERVTAVVLTDAERVGTAPELVVVRDPAIGAFVLPSGRIYLHTGLLARLENEAQLATVLARAVTLAGWRAALERRAAQGRVDDALLAIAASIGAVLATPDAESSVLSPMAEAILGGRLATVYVAAVTGYGRELEAEADAAAMRRIVRAGYDPKQASKTFERLRREARLGGAIERFFLGNDGALGERVEAMARLLATDYAVAATAPDTVTNTQEFEEIMAPVARENARLELRAGRFRPAQEQLDRAIAVWPADAQAHLLYGDLYRLRAQRARGAADRDELARRALAAYERSASLDPDLVEVVRQQGLLYYQQGQLVRAREAFTRYVARNPDAPDAARVKEYLAVLSR